jgi:hypothetical protein
MPLGAALTGQNIASDDSFSAKLLDPASLCVGISTVTAGTLSLFMSHVTYSTSADLLEESGSILCLKQLREPARNHSPAPVFVRGRKCDNLSGFFKIFPSHSAPFLANQPQFAPSARKP